MQLPSEFGYQGFLYIGDTNDDFKIPADLYFNDNPKNNLVSYCSCGIKTTMKQQEASDIYHVYGTDANDKKNKLAKHYFCPSCKNNNFLLYRPDYYGRKLDNYKTVENDKSIIVTHTEVLYTINSDIMPEEDSRIVHRYTIYKHNGSIKKSRISSPFKNFGYVHINETNNFLPEHIFPILLKNTHSQFETLDLYGSNFSMFCKNKDLTQHDLLATIFKHTNSKKSTKRSFLNNLNNESIFVCNSSLIIFTAIGEHIKNTDNTVKILESTFFLEEMGRELRHGSYPGDEGQSFNTKQFIDIFFYIGIHLYGENQFANNIQKMELETVTYEDIPMHIRDAGKSIFRFSKKEAKELINNRTVSLKNPLDAFKGIHDFLSIYNRLSKYSNSFDFSKAYRKKEQDLINKLNTKTSASSVSFKLPSDST